MSSDLQRPRRLRSASSSLAAHGEPWVWLTGGALATAIAMITGLLLFIAVRGASTFWPQPLELVELADGRKALGEVTGREQAPDQEAGTLGRRLIRTAQLWRCWAVTWRRPLIWLPARCFAFVWSSLPRAAGTGGRPIIMWL